MITFFPIFAVSILLITAIGLIALNNTRSGFAYSWLIAALGILLAWPLLFFARVAIPQVIDIIIWRPEFVYPASPTIIIDQISWPFSIALITLALSTILTSVVRSSEGWSDWVSVLVVTAFGILAVMAGNPLTLILGWAALDLIELIIYLWRIDIRVWRDQVVVAFSVRVGGIWLLLLGSTLTGMFETTWSFTNLTQQASILLIFAASIRLGVIYFGGTYRRDYPFSRGFGTILRFAPAGASLMLLARTAVVGVSGSVMLLMLIIVIFIALLAGFAWLFAKSEIEGQPYWILGMTAFSIASSIQGLPESSLAWGLANLFSGALLFLFSVRYRYLIALIILGLLGFSGLPLTPLWNGMSQYSSPITLLVFLLIIPHAMLLAGYFWQAFKEGQKIKDAERWIRVVYPWGLTLLPLAYFIVGDWGLTSLQLTEWSPLILLVSITTLLLAAGILIGLRSGYKISNRVSSVIISFFSMEWLRFFSLSMFQLLGRIVNMFQSVLEGEGGVLWAILLLILILVLLVNVGVVGI